MPVLPPLPDPAAVPGRPSGPHAWVVGLSTLLLTVGIVAGAWGAAYAVNGMTQARANVAVPVLLAPAPGAPPPRVELTSVAPTVDSWFGPAEESGVVLGGTRGQVMLNAWDSTRLEQLLGRGDWLVGGLGVLAGALALRPVLLAIASPRPFARGAGRRPTTVGLVVAVSGVLAPSLPYVAGLLVLQRTGLADTGAFALVVPLQPGPLLVGALLLAAGFAFRAGEAMTRDLDGLV